MSPEVMSSNDLLQVKVKLCHSWHSRKRSPKEGSFYETLDLSIMLK